MPALSIALVYNSMSGDGVAGRGWSVDAGVSSISRVQTVFDLDGKTEPICTNKEEFSWDGRRLFKINPSSTSLEELWRTESETFSEIKSLRTSITGQIEKWEITAKDGTKYYYGSNGTRQSVTNNSGYNTDCNANTSKYFKSVRATYTKRKIVILSPPIVMK